MSMKNSSDIIGNRTRDLPTCSAVSQPTAPPRTHHSLSSGLKCLRIYFIMLYTKHSAAGNSYKKKHTHTLGVRELCPVLQTSRAYIVTLSTHILRKIQTKPQSTEAENKLPLLLLRQILATSKTKQTKGVHINYKHVYTRVYVHKYVRVGGAYARQLSMFWEKLIKVRFELDLYWWL